MRKLVLAIVLAAAPAAFGQAKIGVLNFRAAVVNTKEGQKALEAMEAKFTPKKKELEGKQSAIQALQAELAKGSNTMSEQKRNDLSRQIDSKTRELNRETEDAQAEAEQDQQKLFNELGAKMADMVVQYGKDNGFAVILDFGTEQSNVMYAANDVTKDIVDLFDKATASAPAPAAAKPAAPAPKPAAPPKTPGAKP